VADVPETRIARSSDGTGLAYNLVGEGPLDVVFLAGGAVPVELLWDDPGFQRIAKRLASFSRTIWMDPRGWGASEGDPRDAYVETVSDADLVAVLQTVGADQAALVAWSFTGASAIHFTATHPELVKALVLIDTCAHYMREDDYLVGFTPQSLDRAVDLLREGWATGTDLTFAAPSRAADRLQWWARGRRHTVGPNVLAEVFRLSKEQDVRADLSSVQVPTLVIHREGDRFIHIDAGRYLAQHIHASRFVALPGDDHFFFVGDTDALVDEVEEFLTGARSSAEADVVTATVLFTDIVASTKHQAQVGRREWSRLTDHHDAMVRAALARHQGHEVKATGDGFLATFDATGRAVRCAADIVAGAKDLGLELRAGVHTGEVERRGDDIGGLAVSISKRICDLAEPSQVLVSEMVRGQLVGSGIEFQDRGEHQLKGVPGTWRLYATQD
jgi:class 3 adenylate cyclase